MKEIYVGIDIHKRELTGTAMDKDGEILFYGNFPCTAAAAQSFLSGVPASTATIAIEACGLWRGVYTMLTGLGYHVVLTDPGKIHRIAGAKKTDKIDSKTLADLLRTGYLPELYIPSEDVLRLRDLARHRVRLVRIRKIPQCMIKGQLNRDGIEYEKGWNKRNLAYFKNISPHIANFVEIIEVLNQQITYIDGQIRKVAHNKPLAVLLQTVPGIAEFSSLMILGEIGDVNRFKTPKHLISYAGLCPGIHQSGAKSHPVQNKACNKWLKWIMYECSGIATRMDTKYMKHYYKVKKRKGYQTARRSAARKMLQDIWHMLIKEEPFNP